MRYRVVKGVKGYLPQYRRFFMWTNIVIGFGCNYYPDESSAWYAIKLHEDYCLNSNFRFWSK